MSVFPDEFYCPISFEVMDDPVSDAEGNTYERRVIEQWLASHDVSPLSNAPLAHKHLAPNRALKKLIEEARGRSMLA